jgi:hypothetical protein
MSYRLLEYYEENCGAKNNIFKKHKIKYSLAKYIPMLLFILNVVVLLVFKNLYYLGIGFGINILVAIGLVVWINKIAKKVLKEDIAKKYPDQKAIIVKALDKYKLWNNNIIIEVLFNIDKEKIKLFIKDNKIESLSSLKALRKRFEKEIKDLKPKFPVIPSILGALVLSWFNATVVWMYEISSSIEDGIYVFFIGFGIILMIFLSIIFFKTIITTINEDVLSNGYYRAKRCYDILSFILIEKGEPEE